MGIAIKSFVRLLLVVALSFGPAVPQLVLASPAPADSVHAQHHASDAHDHDLSLMTHGDHHDQTGDSGTCDHHASCGGSCCAACTHCAVAVPAIVSVAPMRSVQIAAPQRLHAILIASSLNRPPKPV